MAARLRLSGLLQRSAAKIFSTPTPKPAASLLSAYVMCRGMASAKLFVGGLAFTTNEQTLRNEFSNFGEVLDVRIITHPDSGRSRGFGFVTMSDENQANAAIKGMDGKVVNARIIAVNLAKPKSPAFPSSFGQDGYGQGGGGGAGFGQQDGFGQGGSLQQGGMFRQDPPMQQGSFQPSYGQQVGGGSFDQINPSQQTPFPVQGSAIPSDQAIPPPPPPPPLVDDTWNEFLGSIEPLTNPEGGSQQVGTGGHISGVQSGFGNAGVNQGGGSTPMQGGSQQQPSAFPTPSSPSPPPSSSSNQPKLSVKTPADAAWDDFLTSVETLGGPSNSAPKTTSLYETAPPPQQHAQNSASHSVNTSSVSFGSVQSGRTDQQVTPPSVNSASKPAAKAGDGDSWDSFLSKIGSDPSLDTTKSGENSQNFETEETRVSNM